MVVHMVVSSLSILLLLLLILFNGSSVYGQQKLQQISNLTKDHPDWVGRITPFRTDSPITREISANVTLQEKLLPVYNFIEDAAAVMDARKSRNDARACNLFPMTQWTTYIWQWMEVFQVGKVDQSCYSQLDVSTAVRNGELPRNYSRNTWKTFRDARQAYHVAMQRIEKPINVNWSNAEAPYSMAPPVKTRDGQRCSVESIFAYNRGGEWYLMTESTNADPSIGMPDYGRQYLVEFIPSNFASAMAMPLPVDGVDGDLQLFTTVITKWRGTGYSAQDQLFDDPAGALSRAYRQNLVTVDLAQDTVTVSNIAILALPMAMNFIPVAFIADLNSLGMVIYVIVTDIISTVPFIVKGVELVISSNPRNRVVLVFYVGNITLATMQAWAVDCSGDVQFRTMGIVFIIVAFVVLAVGIFLEIWARHRMRVKRANAKEDAKIGGPFGAAALETTSLALLGATESRLEDEYRICFRECQREQHLRQQSSTAPTAHTHGQNRIEVRKRRYGF